MKTVSTALKNDMAQEATTFCTCWEITRTDGTVLRFTDLDIPLVVDGNEYTPAVGYNRSAIQTSGDMSVDNMDVGGIIDDSSVTIADLRAGKFDYAEVKIFLVNWLHPEHGTMALRRGWLGEVQVTPDGSFTAELRGLNQALAQAVGETLSPECRADLGDSRCKVDIDGAGYAREGAVTAVTNRRTFVCSITDPDPRASDANWYVGGVLSWLTGDNAGVNIEVKAWNGSDTLELFLSQAFAMQVGDTFRLRPGCDKRRETCKNKFNNIINFRGEPFVPGQDLMMYYPDAQ